ncbi:MAG: hypothetical protein Q7U84_02475, partial [Polynucleobacter sp.]|nr:hypothetical protein [Polynucleobacter sp.]
TGIMPFQPTIFDQRFVGERQQAEVLEDRGILLKQSFTICFKGQADDADEHAGQDRTAKNTRVLTKPRTKSKEQQKATLLTADSFFEKLKRDTEEKDRAEEEKRLRVAAKLEKNAAKVPKLAVQKKKMTLKPPSVEKKTTDTPTAEPTAPNTQHAVPAADVQAMASAIVQLVPPSANSHAFYPENAINQSFMPHNPWQRQSAASQSMPTFAMPYGGLMYPPFPAPQSTLGSVSNAAGTGTQAPSRS